MSGKVMERGCSIWMQPCHEVLNSGALSNNERRHLSTRWDETEFVSLQECLGVREALILLGGARRPQDVMGIHMSKSSPDLRSMKWETDTYGVLIVDIKIPTKQEDLRRQRMARCMLFVTLILVASGSWWGTPSLGHQ